MCDTGYDFISGQPGSSGHFTQLVWKGSNQLGVGRAEAKRDGVICTYVVARYRPAGNFLGEFNRNVFKGGFDASQCASKGKKSTIEVGPYVPKSPTPRYFKRSYIPRGNDTAASKKNGVWEDEDEGPQEPEGAINRKANGVWMADVATGIRGSDMAGVVPLSVSIGTYSTMIHLFSVKPLQQI